MNIYLCFFYLSILYILLQKSGGAHTFSSAIHTIIIEKRAVMPLYTRLLFQYLICFPQKKLKYLHQYIIYGGIMNIKGLDVSEFQGEINWERVKNAGYQFAMIRAGYGFNTIDKQFQRNASECNRIGLPIGVYWFCYAVSPETAIQEADGCLRTIRNYRIDYPVCYDIEQASAAYALGEGVTITPALAKQLVSSFCNRIEAGATMRCFTQTAVF